MFLQLLKYLNTIENYLWSYLAIPLIVLIGLSLTFKSRFSQITKFNQIIKNFLNASKNNQNDQGINPYQVFFASISGCIGIANIVAVCTAIQIGGPGAIFWMWIAALLGMIVKYSEVYLGISYRTINGRGGYNGGPMYYLQKVFKGKFLPVTFAVLLAIYGTEIYMFDVMTHSISENWHLNRFFVVGVILVLMLYISRGEVFRVGKIATIIIPIFLIIFSMMTIWILILHLKELPGFFYLILSSAFKGHAPLGGFAGSSMMLALSQGIARSCYSGDIGVGYAAIVHAESRIQEPHKQAQMTILGVFLDTFIVCTFSSLLVLITGVWTQDIPASLMVQIALQKYFPFMNYFMPTFLFILGFSTLITFFYIGLKCSNYVFPKIGKKIYYIYSISMFVLFSNLDQKFALTIMSITGAFLLSINLTAIHKLRKELKFF